MALGRRPRHRVRPPRRPAPTHHLNPHPSTIYKGHGERRQRAGAPPCPPARRPSRRPKRRSNQAAGRLTESARLVLESLTIFFNNFVLGPDRSGAGRGQPARRSRPCHAAHNREQDAIRRRLADVNDSMENLIRALERTRSPGSQFAARTEARIAELDQEATKLGLQLRNHQAAAPTVPADNVALLDQLPIATIDLNGLSVERLQRFLDAFKVEIHYDGQRVGHGFRPRSRRSSWFGWPSLWLGQPTRAIDSGSPAKNEDGPVNDGATKTIKGSRYGMCPRQDSNLRHRLRRAGGVRVAGQ